MKKSTLHPRKLPVQMRSVATVDALMEAAVQVLLRVGKEKLTTTLVARRAGVSVGTLYQYYPNKGALLRETLRRHLTEMAEAVEQVCREQKGNRLETMGTELVRVFLAAKMRDVPTSVSLYGVGADVEGMKIARQMGERTGAAIRAMLESSCERLTVDAEQAAQVLQGALAGVGRGLVESPAPARLLHGMSVETTALVTAYLRERTAGNGSGPRAMIGLRKPHEQR